MGRYTQPDPLGFVDGPSVYAYAGNRPLAATDRSGLFSMIPTPRGFTLILPPPPGSCNKDNLTGGAAPGSGPKSPVVNAGGPDERLVPLPPPSDASPFQYSDHVTERENEDPYHNFPYSYDNYIWNLGHADWWKTALTLSGSVYIQRSIDGTYSGVKGRYELGMNISLTGSAPVITHRQFIPYNNLRIPNE